MPQTSVRISTEEAYFLRGIGCSRVCSHVVLSVQVFSKVIDKLYAYVHPKTGKKAGLIADDVYDIIQKNKQRLNSALIMDRDFDYDYFGFKTLEK